MCTLKWNMSYNNGVKRKTTSKNFQWISIVQHVDHFSRVLFFSFVRFGCGRARVCAYNQVKLIWISNMIYRRKNHLSPVLKIHAHTHIAPNWPPHTKPYHTTPNNQNRGEISQNDQKLIINHTWYTFHFAHTRTEPKKRATEGEARSRDGKIRFFLKNSN